MKEVKPYNEVTLERSRKASLASLSRVAAKQAKDRDLNCLNEEQALQIVISRSLQENAGEQES
eukprot:3123385-Rhodomonas_salina.1